VCSLCKKAHQWCADGAADDGHADKGTAEVGVGIEVLEAMAKIVGNITDIKKLVTKIAVRPIHPESAMPMTSRKTFNAAYHAMRRLGDRRRMR